MRNKIVVLLALLAITGFAAASALTVKHRQETASLYAERYTLGGTFSIDATDIAPVAADAVAIGTLGAPLEIATSLPAARTALLRDQWMYSVTIKEISPSSAAAGPPLIVELQLDGQQRGQVFLNQSTTETAGLEGARVSFAIGAVIDTSSLYYVVVKPYVPVGPTIEISLASNANGNNTWLGVGGSINNVVNPDVTLATGSTLKITAKNAEASATHNIGVKATGGSNPLDPGWSPNIAGGQETVLSWVASGPGNYAYVCLYHPTMTGKIVVA